MIGEVLRLAMVAAQAVIVVGVIGWSLAVRNVGPLLIGALAVVTVGRCKPGEAIPAILDLHRMEAQAAREALDRRGANRLPRKRRGAK